LKQPRENAPAVPLKPENRPVRDSSGIERLYRDHNAALLRFIRAKLGSEQEAREVAQEAYVRLLRLDNANAISYLEALLFKIAANLALDRIRARARAPATCDIEEHDQSILEPSAERRLAGSQAVDVVRKALDELPAKCRLALLLQRLHGLSQTEIAAHLGIKERMVRLYATRALEHLRRRLDQAEGQAADRSRRSFP